MVEEREIREEIEDHIVRLERRIEELGTQIGNLQFEKADITRVIGKLKDELDAIEEGR